MEHYSTYAVISLKDYFYNIDTKNSSSRLENGKADVIFLIDTTGSMSDAIDNVKNNISSFVRKLKEEKVEVRLGLIEYKDIFADGFKSTKNYGWYYDAYTFGLKMGTLYAAGGGDVLDKTIESLVPLWEWFEDKIEWRELDEEEKIRRLSKFPERMREFISTREPTLLTKALEMDIALYWGEVMVANNPTLYWGFITRPKSLDGVNQPYILGFGDGFNSYPLGLIRVCLAESTEERDKNRLLNPYNIRRAHV